MCSPMINMINNVSILYNYRKYGINFSLECKAENCYKQECHFRFSRKTLLLINITISTNINKYQQIGII